METNKMVFTYNGNTQHKHGQRFYRLSRFTLLNTKNICDCLAVELNDVIRQYTFAHQIEDGFYEDAFNDQTKHALHTNY